MRAIGVFLLGLCMLLMACSANHNKNELHIVTSAEYPPFEYMENGELHGFDIDLIKLIARKMGMTLVFDNVSFSTVFASLGSGKADMAISTITITELRSKTFDFSAPYYFESIAAVYKNNQPVKNKTQLMNKKIASQLGSTMAIWLKKNGINAQLTLFNNSNQCIEALKAGLVDVVVMDGSQGKTFSKKNQGISYHIIAHSKDGYGIAFNKSSPLKAKVDAILYSLNKSGELQQLTSKWFGENHD